MNKVILSLGLGDLDNGFFRVTVQLWTGNGRALMQCKGSLPPAPSLAVLHRNWQSLYKGYYQNIAVRLDLDTTDSEGTDRFSDAEFWETCQKLPQQLNDWLNSDSFRGIEQQLRKHLHHCEEIQLIVETEDTDARKLPWHLWNFLDDYPASEVALSLPEFEGGVSSKRTPPGEVRIIGILGNSINIDITQDKAIIEQLPGAKPEFLSQPKRHKLQTKLWEQDWDILFFAGHSCSSGKIYINALDEENTLTVEELENALRHQINKGLKLAIFNSCESLELAIGLNRLNLPLTIAMREPVPDKVAAVFLKYFLQAFANDKSLYLSVREARERLSEGGPERDDEFRCASWLPVIFQNPAISPPIWQELLGKKAEPWWRVLGTFLLACLVVTCLTVGLRWGGLLQTWELQAFDRLISQRPTEAMDDRFLIVTVSESDIQYQDQLGMKRIGSLSDEALKLLWQKLEPHQPRVIGLDIYHDFSFDPNLAAELVPNKHFIAPCEVGQIGESIPSPPGIPLERLGFTDFPLDSDHVIRRQLLLMSSTSSCNTSQSLSLRIALSYLRQDGISPMSSTAEGVKQIGDLILTRFKANAGGYQLVPADALGYQILINYRSSSFPQVSLREMLSNSLDSQIADLVQDQIVLIGVAGKSKDSHYTPYSQGRWSEKMPGVKIHAHAIAQILSAVQGERPLLWWWPEWVEILWIASWSIVGGLLFWCWREFFEPRTLYLVLAVSTALGILYGLCFFILLQGGWVPLVPSAFTLVATSATLAIFWHQRSHTLQGRGPGIKGKGEFKPQGKSFH